ncbi:DUF4381 domain-containing protein [Pseudomonas citronellolis]|uniref:DUF4381 domain-containing protein n=1 Tax=Pseudomonas citronellolis TaxID=53408 RepID=UPI0023E35913|nr:DUF4381 domain-containing protein [Pseudomonas citronellolis]MDF3935560.1 DUF4381 domain-containing protein [Pseudomonas citronellolis]
MTLVATPSLDRMQELALPAPVASYWPQTWGWLLVLLIVVALLAAWAVRRYLRWRRDRYRREALALFDTLSASLADPHRRLAALRELPALLKRVALSMPGGEASARLGGDDWQAFLQRRSAAPLPADFAQRLALLAYAPAERVQALADGEVQALLAASRHWIEAHHVAV